MLDDLTPYMKDETVVRQALEAYTKGLATGRLEGRDKGSGGSGGDGKSGGKFSNGLNNISTLAQITVAVAIIYLVFNNLNMVDKGRLKIANK